MQQIQTQKGRAIYETRGAIDAPTLVLFHTLLADCSVYDGIMDKLADKLLLGKLKDGNVDFVDEENDSISLKIEDSASTIH